MKTKKFTAGFSLLGLSAIVLSSILFLVSCQKDLQKQESSIPQQKKVIVLPPAINPFSKRNVEKAIHTLATKSSTSKSLTNESESLPQYVYFRFDPNNLQGNLAQQLEKDSIIKLLDFPFANMAIYNDSFALDETKAKELNDGNVYGVTNIEDPIIESLLNAEIHTNLLDTLVLIPEEDTALQFQALLEAGVSQTQIDEYRIRFCFFKRPHGYVKYWDNDLNSGHGQLEPVRRISVWALVFGIPVQDFTDNNGYYKIPWRFSIGTIMGTIAKNERVNVKPFNTVGGWVVTSLIQALVVGSVHIKGWVSSCTMRDDVNFEFTEHKQNRYWSQILNAYAFHYDYCAADGINNAPQGMICYAHWADKAGTDEKDGIGDASTPLWGHMNYAVLTLEAIVNDIFGGSLNIPSNFPNLFNVMTGIAPDNYLRVCGTREPDNYCSRLAQTELHELGHASQFNQVGERWYEEMQKGEILSGTGGYGDPGDFAWGKVQVAESWAEYIGTEYALRRYGEFGFKRSAMLGTIKFTLENQEKEDWFHSRWIPCGVYYDLIDKMNLITEDWDNVSGSSIREMYNVFSPKTGNMCDYRNQFISAYPSYNATDVRTLFNHYSLNCD